MKKRILSLIIAICICFSMLFVGQTVSASNQIGDLFEDDVVNTTDLLYLRKYVAKLIDLDDGVKKNADCNGDNSIDVNDIVTLRNYLIKTEELYKDPSWSTIYDWESDTTDTRPTKVTVVPSVIAVASELDGYGNRKEPESKQALAMKANGVYYQNSVNGTNPTCAYNITDNAPVRIQVIANNSDTLLQKATNLRKF